MKSFAALCLNLFQLCIKIVSLRNNIGPVERDDEGRHNDGLVAAGIDRVLSRSKGLLPDAAMAGAHEAAELELHTRSILRREADVRLDYANLTLLDYQHGHFFNSEEEGVEVISAIEQGIVLEPDLATIHRLIEKAVNTRSEAREAYAGYRGAFDIAKFYQTEILPLRQIINDEMLLNYNGMLKDLFALLTDTKARIAANVQAIDAQRDYWLAKVDLHVALVGGGATVGGGGSTQVSAVGEPGGH